MKRQTKPSPAALAMRRHRERKRLGLPSPPLGRPRMANPSPATLAKREYRARRKALAESLAGKSRAAGTRGLQDARRPPASPCESGRREMERLRFTF